MNRNPYLFAGIPAVYVFPRLRNRNLSHIPARRENVLHQTDGFQTFH